MGQYDEPSRWSLTDLFPEPAGERVESALTALEQAVCDFEAVRPSLSDTISVPDFKVALAKLEVLARLKTRIEAYADLSFFVDTNNPDILSLRDRISQLLAGISNRCLFFDFWFKELPDDVAARLVAESGGLHYFLGTIQRFKPYLLTEAEEKVITSKDVNGIDALIKIYDMITTQFTYSLEVDGGVKSLTEDELASYFYSPSGEMRERAYRELLRVYEQNAVLLAEIYIHRVRDWHSEGIEMRRYASPIAARNLENDLPNDVVETLLSICRHNVGLFQRYFRLKQRFLGLDVMRGYDLYAPLAQSDKRFTYAEATRMVLDSYMAFSPEVAAMVKRVFDENHVDSEIRRGKIGGAFCYSALPEMTPWVLSNYGGRARDIAVLAHELGHAVHGMLAGGHSILTRLPTLPLAETASIFGEMLLTDRLLKQEQDPAMKRELLAHALDDAYGTVMRQAYLTIFEKDAHAMIVSGCTADDLAAQYLANLREQVGDAVQMSDDFKWRWIGIPHIYEEPFYTYAYSFGQLLVLALYQQYKREGPEFLPRYLRILSYGGSEAPLKVLSEAGIDIASADFWQGGFDILKGMLAELEGSA